MSTKEDILEQVVEEYLHHKGYFVQHNVKFKPSPLHKDFNINEDCVPSDIDILAINPKISGPEKIIAVSCKSWQQGFKPAAIIREIEDGGKRNGRATWKGFRELCIPKWSEAFLACIENYTGERRFLYLTAVTHLRGDASPWEENKTFHAAMEGNPVKIITFKHMFKDIQSELTETLAATEVGRLIQLIRASRLVLRDSLE